VRKREIVLTVAALGIAAALVVRLLRNGQKAGLDQAAAAELLSSIQAAYGSTLAALDAAGTSDEFDARDARAAADAARLERTFEGCRNELTARLLPSVSTFVDCVRAAQVQIMAFAVNRKNRGLPDAAQAAAEAADRRSFRREAAPLVAALAATLS
jgi:hypothetical protein